MACSGVIREEDIFEYPINLTIPVDGTLGGEFYNNRRIERGGTERREFFIQLIA